MMEIQVEKQEVPQVTNFLQDMNRDDIRLRFSLRSQLADVPRKVLNRRYKKLQQLIEGDEYFSEESIQIREPVLFHLYVGRYKRENGELQGSVAELLMTQILKNQAKVELEEALETCGYKKQIDLNETEDISQADLDDNIDELVTMMHDRFLVGGDHKFFDYSQVDNNEEYDDAKMINQDAEDNYFERDEQSENDIEIESQGTGIQDF